MLITQYMSNVTPVEEDYEYPGWLVFNGLFKTTVHGDGSISPQEIIDNFDKYTPGSPKDPESGFEIMPLSEKLQDMGELNEATESFARGLHSLQYVDEDWVEQWGYDENGNEAMYFHANHDEVRIYWDYVNDVMMFKGQKQLIEQKQDDLVGALSGDIQMDTVTFDFDFFLWVLYKEYQGEQLTDDLRVRNITRGSTLTETKDNMGAGQVQDSNNILRSILLIAPVLSGKKIKQIQGNFILGNHQVKAAIKHGGKVHVKVSDSPLSMLSDLRRMGVSLRFLSKMVNLFQNWERLDPEERYPPPAFFDNMAENAEEEGWGPGFDPDDLKSQYERKRQAAIDENSRSVPAEDAS